MKMEIKLDKIYESRIAKTEKLLDFDKNHKTRPSWIRVNVHKPFIKILIDRESFWYRRYFENFYFIFEPTPEDYKNYYNEIAEDYEELVSHNEHFRGKILKLFDEFEIDKSAKILDVGAGTGLVTEEIARKGFDNITLLDISEKELEIAKAKESLKNAKYQLTDLMSEKIIGKFDVVFGTMSLDYFKGDKMIKVLKKINNALKKQGKFISIQRHRYPEFNLFFNEIKKGKFRLKIPGETIVYFYYVGEKK